MFDFYSNASFAAETGNPNNRELRSVSLKQKMRATVHSQEVANGRRIHLQHEKELTDKNGAQEHHSAQAVRDARPLLHFGQVVQPDARRDHGEQIGDCRNDRHDQPHHEHVLPSESASERVSGNQQKEERTGGRRPVQRLP